MSKKDKIVRDVMTWEEFHEHMRKSGNVKMALESVQRYRDWYYEERKKGNSKMKKVF